MTLPLENTFSADTDEVSSVASVCPASGNQVRYVLAELSKAGSYMIPVGHMVEGHFDAAAFSRAASMLVARHDALRTRFEIADGSVQAIVLAEPQYRLHQCTMVDAELSTFRNWALPLIFEDVEPRAAGSLIRFLVADYADRWRFTIAAHHAITDGFSRGTMNKELLKLYAGEDLQDARSYYDFARPFVREAPVSEEVAEFVERLPRPAQMAGDGVASEEAAGQFVKRSFEDQQAKLRSVCKGLGTTKFGLLTAVYGLALSRFSIGEGTSTFFQTEGRKTLGAPNSVIGPFSNTLPMNASFDPDARFGDLACAMAQRTKEAVALETEPVLDATIAAGKAPGVSINMFPPAGRVMAGELEIGPREFLDRRTEFDLNLVWSDDQGVLNARAYFDPAKLSEDRVAVFLAFLSRILAAVIEEPDRTCRDILNAARVGHESQTAQRKRTPNPETRLHEQFFAMAEKSPDALAVITSTQTLSYRDLAGRALDVLGSIQARGVTPSDRVVILAERGVDLVAGMLGVSASGASFAILDCSYPTPRLNKMVEQLGARWILGDRARLAAEADLPLERIRVTAGARTEAKVIKGPPRAEACHLFTSGSSGQPKLKTHPDQTVQRFIAWQADTLGLEDPITTMMFAGVSHDPTLRDILLPFSHGGRIAIPSPSEMRDPEALRRLLVTAGCNVLRLSPTTASLLSAGIGPDVVLKSLRGVFWGGERLPFATVDRWRRVAPEARQFHIFGTTETPQAFLAHEIRPEIQRMRNVPLGRPLPWTGVRIVDDAGAAVAFGEIGEITALLADPVGGVDSKFHLEGEDPACQHCTGDRGYMTPDGLVWFLGRQDGQIKINDFRIEPGEIEAVAEQTAGVTRAVVVPKDGQLTLFVLTERQDLSGTSVRRAIGQSLPSHMVPAHAVIVDHIPETPNGKVDKDALLALSERKDDVGEEGVLPPTGPDETAIAAVFEKFAGRPVKDRSQSLFDLGADSLASIEARMDLESSGFALPNEWQSMPISALAEGRRAAPAANLGRHPALETSRIETDVLVRALAILAIVANHTGVTVIVGASIVLFALAGYAFGRLQLPAILRDDHSGRVWALLGRLLIPLVPMSFLYTGLTNDLRIDADLRTNASALFLFRNFEDLVNSVFLGREAGSLNLIWLWFLHVYLQMFLVIGILLSFPRVRRALASDIWKSLAIVFVLAEAVSLASVLVLSRFVESFEQAGTLLDKSPTTILPFLILGALFASAESVGRRVTSLAFAVLHMAYVSLVFPQHAEVWWIITLVACWLVPFIALPKVAANVVVMIAAFSLMIYLVHPAVGSVFEAVFGEGAVAMPINIVLQLSVGVLAGLAMRPVFDRIGLSKLARRRISF